MKNIVARTFTGCLLAAGLVLAQAPAPAPGAAAGPLRRLVKVLNLTPDQQTQAKSIFQAGKADTQPVAAQMKQARQALSDAVKNNVSDAQIDQLAAAVGPLSSQLAAIRTKTMAKFYAILTPEQKTRFNAIAARVTNGGGLRPKAFRNVRRTPPAQQQ